MTLTVVDAEGAPVESASLNYVVVGDGMGFGTAADKRGFISVDLPSAEIDFTIRAKGFLNKKLGPRQLSPGKPFDFGRVTIERAAVIRCTIVDENNAPILQSFASLNKFSGESIRGVSKSGTACRYEVPPGSYRVTCVANGYAGRTVDTVVDQAKTNELRVTLSRGFLQLIDLVSNGVAIEDVKVSIVVRDGANELEDQGTKRTLDGLLGLTLSRGLHRIDISTKDGRKGVVAITVPESQDSALPRIRVELQ